MVDHEIELIGEARSVAALRAELVAHEAQHLTGCDRVHLAWTSERPELLEMLSAAHPDVDVRVRRVATTDEVREVLLVGGRTVVDRARRVFRDRHGEVSGEWGLCMDEDGDLLDATVLRRVADDVLATEVPVSPARPARGVVDALALLTCAGRLAQASGDPFDARQPTQATLAHVRELASLALSLSCTSAPGATELWSSRSWRLREALVVAGGETLWDVVEGPRWDDWAGRIAEAACSAVEACRASSWTPTYDLPEGDPVPHLLQPDGHLVAATGSLVATCLQALALWCDAP